jgi:hypothetical protein
MTPADRQVHEHAAALRAHEAVLRESTAVQLALLPQVLGMVELRTRRHLSEDVVVAALDEHAGYRGTRGQRVRVPINVVLRLDRIAKAGCSVLPGAASGVR